MPIDVQVVATSSLGDRSYLAHDGRVAVVVDPQRDIDRVVLLAGRLGVRITHVVETHLHNDYVSGGLRTREADRGGLSRRLRPRRWTSSECRCPTATRSRSRNTCGSRWWRRRGTPSHHVSYVLHGAHGPGACSPAGHCCSARPVAPTCSASSTRTPWPTTSTPPRTDWPTCCPTARGCGRRTGSAASARLPSPTPTRRPSAREKMANPALRPGGRRLRRPDARRPGRLSRLLRAHGHAQRRRAPELVDLTPARRPTPAELRAPARRR